MNNLDLLRKRLQYESGKNESLTGDSQKDRMIKDKYRTLQKAMLYSYQGARVKKILNGTECRALINPNKLKMDYDDKILSTNFENNFKPGDIFEWVGTGTYWIVYLQELTELAYFRGAIRRCSFQIKWLNAEGQEKNTYAAVRGPVETQINSIQKHGDSVDVPNYSLHILMPGNKDTIEYFQRYAKFYLDLDLGIPPVCWRVEAVDYISTPGVLEINAEEYYSNLNEDDLDSNIVGGLIEKPEDLNQNSKIQGESFIKPHMVYEYSFLDQSILGEWTWKKGLPIEIIEEKSHSIKIKWTANYSGQFDLIFGDYKNTIVVESLF